LAEGLDAFKQEEEFSFPTIKIVIYIDETDLFLKKGGDIN